MENGEAGHKPLFDRSTLLKLVIPLVIEQLLAMTIGMADTMMVTSVGEAAVSGVALVDSINLLLIQIFAALATGGAVVASQYLGRRDHENACISAKQLLYVSTGAATVLMLVALLFRQQVLTLIFGHVEQDVMDNALIYFLLTGLSFPFLAIYNSGAALFRSMGNSKVSMFTSLGMNIVNIGGNAMLIFGLGWGTAGAGTSTLVSRAGGALVMLALVCHKKHPIHIERLWKPEFHGGMVRSILRIGVPNGLENGMFQVGKLLVQNLISTFGTSAIAANAIANSVAGIVNVPGSAIGLALITVVGQCMGARDPDQAVSYTKKFVGITYLAMGSMSILMFFTAGPLIWSDLFQLSPGATVAAIEVLRWSAVFQLLCWPLAFCLPNALRAAGDARFTMLVSMFSMWAFRIGLSYVFAASWGFNMGLLGVWMAMFVDWFVRSIFFLVRFWRGRWKQIRLI